MINVKKLLENYCNFIAEKELLLCGGASGHMSHLFEDPDLKFSDLKKIFTQLFKGKLTVEEKCLSPDTIVQLENHGKMKIKDVVDNKIVDNILTYDFDKKCTCYEPIEDWIKNTDSSEWLKITLEDGSSVICTPNHRIYNASSNKDVKAEELTINDELIIS